MRPILPALLLTGLLTAACEKESSAPYLDFISTSTTLTTDRRASAADTFEVRAFAEDRELEEGPGLQRFTITAKEQYFRDAIEYNAQDAAPLVYFDTVFSAVRPVHSFLFVNRFGASTNAGTQDWEYTLTDNNGQRTRRSIRIVVRPTDSLNVVHSYSVRLQAPRRTSSRATLSALRGFVLPPHATYTPAYQALADIVYVPTATGPSLAAPSSTAANQAPLLRTTRWQQRRATQLATTTLTSTDFTNATTAEPLTNAVDAVSANFVESLPVTKGAVVAFKTVEGLNGLLYVRDFGTTAPVDLIVDVKVLRR